MKLMIKKIKNDEGFNILELMFVVTITAVITAYGVFDSKELAQPTDTASEEFIAQYKKIRARSVYNTRAYEIKPISSTDIRVRWREKCINDDDGWTRDSTLEFELPDGATMTDESWSLCINSRGFPKEQATIPIEDIYGNTKSIEVFLGGGIE